MTTRIAAVIVAVLLVPVGQVISVRSIDRHRLHPAPR